MYRQAFIDIASWVQSACLECDHWSDTSSALAHHQNRTSKIDRPPSHLMRLQLQDRYPNGSTEQQRANTKKRQLKLLLPAAQSFDQNCQWPTSSPVSDIGRRHLDGTKYELDRSPDRLARKSVPKRRRPPLERTFKWLLASIAVEHSFPSDTQLMLTTQEHPRGRTIPIEGRVFYCCKVTKKRFFKVTDGTILSLQLAFDSMYAAQHATAAGHVRPQDARKRHFISHLQNCLYELKTSAFSRETTHKFKLTCAQSTMEVEEDIWRIFRCCAPAT